VHGSLYLIEKEAQYRRQAAEHTAQRWRLANLGRLPSGAWTQAWARSVDLAKAGIQRANRWLARTSKPQEQC
jgi:hypothetical protein